MDDEMRLINYICPPMTEGTYTVEAVQTVTQPKESIFRGNMEFHITGNVYSLPQSEVYSVFPAENESGEFTDILPFLVSTDRTLPWELTICSDKDGVPVPWVALIVIASNEDARERDLTLEELWKKEEGIYFPERSAYPDVSTKKTSDMCHVVELSRELYHSVMPSIDDLPYLCHARSVNLRRTEDKICAMDGFFSVVCANRFVPSGTDAPLKSTVHLVSLLGYGEGQIPDSCQYVRLVSLFHWDIHSERSSEENFSAVIERLKENCGAMGFDMQTELQRRGYCAAEHFTRTGEETYSLYRSPLLPFINSVKLPSEQRYTADGHLIYDREKGILDVTYAAAFQLGRMLTLSHQALAESVINYRKKKKVTEHQRLLNANIDFSELELEELTKTLAEKGLGKRGQKK